jgi:predicted nucleic acid-binding protein
VIVVDTSAWVEYFRQTGSAVHRHLDSLLDTTQEIAVTEMIVAELLAGAGDEALPTVRSRLIQLRVLRLRGLRDYEAAATLSRACRRGGESVRSLADCLIAVPTIRAGATLLQADRDFEKLARHTPLRLEPV